MNIVELNNAIKSVRSYLKSNPISMVGDFQDILINPKNVIFGGEIPSDFTYHVGDINVSYVNRGAAAGILGFKVSTLTTTCLNKCISGTGYYNGNHDHEDFDAISLIETGFEGDLVLVITWEKGDWDSGELTATLYTTPNFVALKEAAEVEDEQRWIENLGSKSRSRR